ncbi:MAG: sporulation protein YqfD [Ruminococcus sp.]|nr:sporulation protein YqfD [Ruminococcus sp.]
MRKKLRGSIKICAEGHDIYSFINGIHAERIGCFGQYIRHGCFCAEIYRSDLGRLEEIAHEHGVKLTCTEQSSFSSEIMRRRRRYGLIIGLVLVAAASLFFSGTVVTIDIQGNDRISDSVILAALDELDIRRGTPFGQINYVNCENQLQLMVEGLSWAGMHRTGHRLVVEVTELVEKPEMVHSRIPCNLVAEREAEIVGTSVLDGQLMHKVGDYVMQGDMLVSGVTGDETGHTTLHHAMGTIMGIYSDEVIFTGKFVQERLVPTGRTDTRSRLWLFSLDIPLYIGGNSYDLSRKETTSVPLRLFGKTLPISLVRSRYTEYERTETELTGGELKDVLMQKVYIYEKNFLSDCEILERRISSTEKDGTLTLDVAYRLKGDICSQREILIK